MKPDRSPQVTATLPTSEHSVCTVAVTSGAVDTVWTTSTSLMTWAGLKKCIPTTSCGREVTFAQSMIGRDEVVVARIAPGVQIRSRSRKRSCFTPRSSAIASTTRSTSARASRPVAPATQPRRAAACAAGIRPVSTPRAQEGPSAVTTSATLASERATNVTGYPARAKTSMMPVAMVPDPTTPTDATVRSDTPAGGPSAGVRASATTCGDPGSA